MSDSEALKRHVSDVFSRASTFYDTIGDRAFSIFGKKLVEFACISPGARLLDVACGSGAVLIPAFAAASPGGQAIGVDLSQGMVERAKKELARSGIADATVVAMDAEDLVFPDDSFDFVLCGLSLFFFPNLQRALGEFRRVLKKGGYLVASTMGRPAADAMQNELRNLKDAYREAVVPAHTVTKLTLTTAPEIAEALSRAGFVDIQTENDSTVYHYKSADEWWQSRWSDFNRDFLERMDKSRIDGYKRDILGVLERYRTEDGIPWTSYALLSRARKP